LVFRIADIVNDHRYDAGMAVFPGAARIQAIRGSEIIVAITAGPKLFYATTEGKFRRLNSAQAYSIREIFNLNRFIKTES